MGWFSDLRDVFFPPRRDVAPPQDLWPSSSARDAASASDEAGVQFKSPETLPPHPLELTEKLPSEEPKVAAEPTLFRPRSKSVSTPKTSAATKKRQSTTARKRAPAKPKATK